LCLTGSTLCAYLSPQQGATPKSRQFRIFRNHYLCDACPNEWSDEAMVVAASYCPCCDAEAEPYDSEALLDDVVIVTEEIE
jgi:hypothetical protein